MRRFVAFLAGPVVLVSLNLLAPIVMPSAQYESGNHEIATVIALAAAFLAVAIVYALYPRVRQIKITHLGK